jgi:hypothetical protein
LKIPFGFPVSLDPSEYRAGTASVARDCYRFDVPGSGEEHWRKRPGLDAVITGLGGQVNGLFIDKDGTVLAAVRDKIYEIWQTTETLYTGTIQDQAAIFAEDRNAVYVATGGKIARIDTSAKTVTDLGGNSPDNVTHVVFSKGYLLSNGLVSGGVVGDVNYSDDSANDYEAADSWELFNNEAHPDGVDAVTVGWDGEVSAWGSNSVEVSYNDGQTPWAVLQGATMEYGILAPYSLASIDNTFFWLLEADNVRRIVRMRDRVPTIISTPFDRLLQTFEKVSDARAWAHTMHGISFYVITFPTADTTWAMRADTGVWSEFRRWNSSTASYERYLGQCGIWEDARNRFLVGSRTGGNIYEQTGTQDISGPIRMQLSSGEIDHGTNKRKRERRLYHRVKHGYGEGEGTFGFRMRDDHGQWMNERHLPLGALGETNPYIKRPSGGRYRSRQYEYIHADTETDFIVMGLEVDVEMVE